MTDYNKPQAIAGQATEPKVYDLVGVGYGPANLALSIALREEAEKRGQSFDNAIWLEKSHEFAWHTSLLLPGAQLQVSPLKDMATMRNPCSTFTFVNYLFTKGRLASYINKESSIPSRREWSAYLTWCAERMEREVADVVRYSSEVVAINVVSPQGAPKVYKVTYRNTQTGAETSLLARNISIAIGGAASIPEIFAPIYHGQSQEKARLIHSSHYLPSLAKIRSELAASKRPLRIGVIGSGQSSAEMTCNLHSTFPNAQVEMIFRGPAIRPSDDSSFVNAAAFDPEATESFWQADLATRRKWRNDFERTNYAVVRSNVLNELFTLGYDQEIELDAPLEGAAGPTPGRVDFRPNTSIKAVAQNKANGPITLTLTTVGVKEDQVIEYDAVFLGTGFKRQLSSLACVQPLAEHYPLINSNEVDLIKKNGYDEPTTADLDDIAERKRERNRGITRDYRLVSYHALQSLFSSSASTEESAESLTARRDSDRSDASSSSSATLAGSGRNSLSVSPERQPADKTAQQQLYTVKKLQELRADEGNVYVMGANEPTHGLSDSLLSVSAYRAGEVAESFIRRLALQQQWTKAHVQAGQEDPAIAAAKIEAAAIAAKAATVAPAVPEKEEHNGTDTVKSSSTILPPKLTKKIAGLFSHNSQQQQQAEVDAA